MRGFNPCLPAYPDHVRVELAFTAVSRAPSMLRASDAVRTPAFASRPNPGANRRVGAEPSRSIVQRELVPTNRFRYELLARTPGLTGSRLPFHIDIDGQPVSLNLRLRQFPPLGLRATAKLKWLMLPEGLPANELIELQEARRSDPVAAVLRRSLGMMRVLDHRNYDVVDQPSVMAATHIVLPEGTRVQRWAEEHRRDLVAVLLRTDPEHLTDLVVDKTTNECAGLNGKVTSSHTLIAKPGLLHVSLEGRDSQPSFDSLVELQAMAKSTGDFLAAFAARRADGPDVFDFFLHLARSWVETPETVMSASYGGTVAWERLCAVLNVGGLLNGALTEDAISRLAVRETTFAPLREGYWLDDAFEDRLSEKLAIDEGEHGLEFIADPALRRIVRRDLFEARTCLETRAFKAALVLAGSVAEALMLATVLSHGSDKSEPALGRMGLQNLVAEAKLLGAVPDAKTINLIDDWLRHYRNLIHPGRERRDNDQPNSEKAQLAVQAVEVLAQQLSDAHLSSARA